MLWVGRRARSRFNRSSRSEAKGHQVLTPAQRHCRPTQPAPGCPCHQPVGQRLLRHPQVLDDLGDQLAASAEQPDHLSTELRRMGRTGSRRVDSIRDRSSQASRCPPEQVSSNREGNRGWRVRCSPQPAHRERRDRPPPTPGTGGCWSDGAPPPRSWHPAHRPTLPAPSGWCTAPSGPVT
jgi:hypothetical protein